MIKRIAPFLLILVFVSCANKEKRMAMNNYNEVLIRCEEADKHTGLLFDAIKNNKLEDAVKTQQEFLAKSANAIIYLQNMEYVNGDTTIKNAGIEYLKGSMEIFSNDYQLIFDALYRVITNFENNEASKNFDEMTLMETINNDSSKKSDELLQRFRKAAKIYADKYGLTLTREG